MAINMPHEGGLHVLNAYFGTLTTPSTFSIWFYKADPGTWDDETIANGDANLFDIEDYPASLNDLLNTSVPPATLASTSPQRIQVVNGVPQVEFPEVKVDIGGTISGVTNLYGYAVLATTGLSPDKRIVFREKFDSPFAVVDGAVLRFIPTFRIGNTTAKLT